jgi:hypothetical protein
MCTCNNNNNQHGAKTLMAENIRAALILPQQNPSAAAFFAPATQWARMMEGCQSATRLQALLFNE